MTDHNAAVYHRHQRRDVYTATLDGEARMKCAPARRIDVAWHLALHRHLPAEPT